MIRLISVLSASDIFCFHFFKILFLYFSMHLEVYLVQCFSSFGPLLARVDCNAAQDECKHPHHQVDRDARSGVQLVDLIHPAAHGAPYFKYWR